jgi:hypothetical protein
MNVDLSAPTRPAPPASGSERRAGAHVGIVAAVVAVLAVGAAMRFAAGSDLWLDEALTVNIARLPLDRLRPALLHDGAPPLSYVLLHFWMLVFGSSTAAVRALSGVLGVVAIGLGALAARAWAPADRTARYAALGAIVVATSPFALRYSTEVRMYVLTIVLGLLGIALAGPAWREPTFRRLAGIAIVTAGLLYTQYWSFFLVGVVGLGLLVAAVRGTPAVVRSARRMLVAVIVGLGLFLPWWPTFSDQLAHTGTPWDVPTTMYAGLRRSVLAFGGAGWLRWLVTALLVALLVTGCTAARRGARTVAWLASATALATIVVGVAGSVVAGSGFQDRYLAVVFPLLALAIVLGAAAISDRRVAVAAVALLAASGLASGWHALRAERTASTAIARALRGELRTGDVVAYCPDQLGPSTARLLPARVTQLTFPEGASPRLVDWTDYAARNRAASPSRFVATVLARAGTGRVFLAFSGGYRTLGTKCEATITQLLARRPHPVKVTAADGPNGERVELDRFDP